MITHAIAYLTANFPHAATFFTKMITHAIAYLTANFPYAAEFQSFWMAMQGAMVVRNGPNKKGEMSWFHAFAQGVLCSYAGSLFAPFWMGRPTSMFSSDLNMASCIIAYIIVNCLPMGIGHKICKLLPVRLATIMGAQLFRSMGLVKFVNIAYEAFKDHPSVYYPTPIFGPILNGTLLANMGAFFLEWFSWSLTKWYTFSVSKWLAMQFSISLRRA